jgi:hypothetical protein
MIYEIIDPPFYIDFRSFSKKEHEAYREWFFSIMPERIKILTQAVHSTLGFELWEPDYSPESLNLLGQWFAQVAETREKTAEEIEAERELMKGFAVGIATKVINNKTISVCYDIGMYLSQVFLKQYPQLTWDQNTTARKSLDYGQLVLKGFGGLIFNPVYMMETLATPLAYKTKAGEQLRELYEIWKKYILT